MISISNEDEHDGVKNRIAVQMYRVSQKESHPESDRGKWSWLDIEDNIGLETLAIYHISGTQGNEVPIRSYIHNFLFSNHSYSTDSTCCCRPSRPNFNLCTHLSTRSFLTYLIQLSFRTWCCV